MYRLRGRGRSTNEMTAMSREHCLGNSLVEILQARIGRRATRHSSLLVVKQQLPGIHARRLIPEEHRLTPKPLEVIKPIQ